MNLKPFGKYLKLGILVFLVIAASMLFYFILFHMGTLRASLNRLLVILLPILYGAAIAYIFNPVVRLLEVKLIGKALNKLGVTIGERLSKLIRLFCILLTVFLLFLAIYGLLAMLIPQLLESITNIIDSFPLYIDNIQVWITRIFTKSPESEAAVSEFFSTYAVMAERWLTNEILPQLNNFIKDFSVGIMGVIGFLKNIILGIIISIYILYSKENLIGNAKKGLYAVFSGKRAGQLIKDVQYINKTFGGYLMGMIIDSANIGILCYIGTSILSMPYALLISVIVAVTNVIPFFGPYLGGIPSTLLILLVDPVKALYFVIFIFVLQQIDGNFIAPRILSGATGLSSFMVVVAIILGGGFFGILGMLIGVPVCAVICTVIKNQIEGRLAKKNLPREQSFYTGIDHVDTASSKAVQKVTEEIAPEEVFRYGSIR